MSKNPQWCTLYWSVLILAHRMMSQTSESEHLAPISPFLKWSDWCEMKVILKVDLDFPQYCEIRICSCTAASELRFENIRNYQKSFNFLKLRPKVLPQKFLFAFPSIFSKKIFLARIAWLDMPKGIFSKNSNFEPLERQLQQ